MSVSPDALGVLPVHPHRRGGEERAEEDQADPNRGRRSGGGGEIGFCTRNGLSQTAPSADAMVKDECSHCHPGDGLRNQSLRGRMRADRNRRADEKRPGEIPQRHSIHDLRSAGRPFLSERSRFPSQAYSESRSIQDRPSEETGHHPGRGATSGKRFRIPRLRRRDALAQRPITRCRLFTTGLRSRWLRSSQAPRSKSRRTICARIAAARKPAHASKNRRSRTSRPRRSW